MAALIILAIGIWMAVVGLETASALGGAIGLLVAIAALFAPYLVPAPPSASASSSSVKDSGNARATAGGKANSGVRTQSLGGSSRVENSGEAVSDGPDSDANTGLVG